MKNIYSLLLLCLTFSAYGQTDTTYQIIDVVRLPATSIKSQDQTGTCWAFSALSMFESEMIRLGKDSVSLSPMFIASQIYKAKAEKFIRMHGHMNFGQGGEFHDVTWTIKNIGIVPLSAFKGYQKEQAYDHSQLYSLLNAYLETLVKQKNIEPAWKEGFNGILNAYIGSIPNEFEYKGKTYSSVSFYQYTGLNMDNYVCLTSFNHHPFYKSCILELEDNWMNESIYNVPIDDFMKIMENSIEKGYTFTWGADVSEKGFSWKKGTIILTTDSLNITQELRQKAFENYQTTDDHGMHIIGKANDTNGTPFFIVKNSWGIRGEYKGYLYVSLPYVAYKTTVIMVHKNAIPKNIQKKLDIK